MHSSVSVASAGERNVDAAGGARLDLGDLTTCELSTRAQSRGEGLCANIALQNFMNGRLIFNNAGKSSIKETELEADLSFRSFGINS